MKWGTMPETVSLDYRSRIGAHCITCPRARDARSHEEGCGSVAAEVTTGWSP